MTYGGVSKPSTRQPGLLVDVERQRPARVLHPLAAQPALGAREERARDLLVVDGVEEAEEARSRRRSARGARDRSCAVNRPTHQPFAVGAEDGALAVLEERVLLRVEAVLQLHVERADVGGVVPVDVVDDVEEVVDAASHRNLPDVDHGAEDGYHDPGLWGSSSSGRRSSSRSVAQGPSRRRRADRRRSRSERPAGTGGQGRGLNLRSKLV